jgi:hypothetical protein
MKNILLLFLTAFLTFGSITYASFPVTDNVIKSEVMLTQADDKINPFAPPTEFHFGGFLLGLLLGLIGVGLAYIFSDNADFRRNAWYGFGTWLIILLILSAGA